MRTLFDPAAREELIRRISLLQADRKPLWGSMNVYQMARHCTIWNDWILGKKEFVYKQAYIGKLLGRIALRNNTKDDRPIGRNMPAGAGFTVAATTGDLEAEISNWIQQIKDYENFSNDQFIHDFFGKMTPAQIGIFAYKHNDHHLRQFNA